MNETVSTQLIMSKTRVAPLEPMSVPHLELLVSLISSRLVIRVKIALSPVVNIEEIVGLIQLQHVIGLKELSNSISSLLRIGLQRCEVRFHQSFGPFVQV